MDTNDNAHDAYYNGLYYYFKERDKEAQRLEAGMKGHETKQHDEFLNSEDYKYMQVFEEYRSNERALNKMIKNAQNDGDKDEVDRLNAQIDGIREEIAKRCLAIYFGRDTEEEVK